MNETELSALIEKIVAEVLAGGTATPDPACDEGRDKILVIGEPSAVPAVLQGNAVLYGLSDYEAAGNILRYKKVIVTKLTMLELADLALGRASCPAVNAVMEALLNGREVQLLESGLPHRKYSGKGSTKLYALLEGYVRTIMSFGVKSYAPERLVTREPLPEAAPKFAAPKTVVPEGTAVKNPERLITEDVAKALCQGASGSVHLARNAIVTPSALDCFKARGLKVEKDL